jgi:L-alanine-DL-glutamate epimerase-like enolase superfamily enzyme
MQSKLHGAQGAHSIAPLATGSLRLHAEIEKWPLIIPFRITGYTFEFIDVLLVRLETGGHVGRGEAAGVYYRDDTPTSMLKTIESVRSRIEGGLSRESLQAMLGPGGARNALDCALWDLEAKLAGLPAWQLAGLQEPRELLTTFTCGAADPKDMAATARAYPNVKALKLKLTGEPVDADRVLAVRAAMPGVWLGVDANQGFTRASLDQLMPTLAEAQVALIEQPFPVGEEAWLDGFRSPIPIAADESIQSLVDVRRLVGRFDVVNIKLDKCGGLTEGLAMAREARQLGMGVMVGNMMGTSLAIAPAFVLGQLCDVVDLDGPVFLQRDRDNTVIYNDGLITCPDFLWGCVPASAKKTGADESGKALEEALKEVVKED